MDPAFAVQGVVGALIILAIWSDVFLTVVVPRRAPRTGRLLRPSKYIVGGLWRPWRAIGLRIGSGDRREAFLGSYGALAVILLLVFWLTGLVVGFGLVFHALSTEIRPEAQSLGVSMYYAGTSLLTLGFGDFVATDWPARALTLIAAATGLGIFASTITLLFTLYGSFQRREIAVVVLEAGAGAPPSGVSLLETYALAGILDDLPQVFREWQAWAAELLDSHLAYPVLAFFRSSHDNDSWISSLGAVMDAATLVLTTIEDGPKGWAKLYRAVGGHCIEDLVYYFDLETDQEVGLEREEFEEARRRLARAGFRLQDADLAWANFSRLRQEYAGRINALARNWATPPAQWIGDRSPLRSPRLHTLPQPAAPTGVLETR
ncbi:MAG: two pore domain potassium channel family protein [Chloroflexi bacterium]|nr:two pore domain potassium channel family protein [Chloroflexota bacterium]MBV9545673.1 two pore domain potassium channel family protein [Chloroflexota bacterium]